MPGVNPTRLTNAAALLATLREHGVSFRLHGCPPTLQFRLPTEALPPPMVVGLELCREGLTLALRQEAGLCVACGVESPTRHTPYCTDCLWARIGDHFAKLQSKRPPKVVKPKVEADPTSPNLTMEVLE